jgi:hypothetical protein
VLTRGTNEAPGMSHSADMYAFYTGFKQKLTTDDVAGI